MMKTHDTTAKTVAKAKAVILSVLAKLEFKGGLRARDLVPLVREALGEDAKHVCSLRVTDRSIQALRKEGKIAHDLGRWFLA